ncbi:MAG: zinc transporter ZupT [Myxococcota bacterium]|jgi:ZIP family zinc transporter|nr:zinc transporter ZupT [Myxococcota bacterium]
MDGSTLLAFSLTLFAGLATGVGSTIAFLSKQNSPRFLSLALGFSAGVMIYVSMVEILVKARDSLIAALGEGPGSWTTVAAFFGGIGVIALIDKLVPEATNPHEAHTVEEMDGSPSNRDKHLMRMGVATALAIAIHNFPEGLATFTAAMENPSLGIAIAVAIAIHNIPEGIAVSVPLYYATKSRKKAFFWSFLSGLSEPVGALVGWFLLRWLFSDTLFGVLFAGVAGIMVFISLDELLPTAREYGEHHLSIIGVVLGMAVMAVSLLLLM